MGRKDEQNQKQKERVEAVLHLLKKQAPLTVKQEKFCNDACVERFLKEKGESVKKATKQLRACLSWRESVGIENLIADEFSAELAEGVAYVAGHDDESRPVMILRIKQDYQKFHSQKQLIRLVVFTLEVAIQTMARNVEQFVLLLDASFFKSASAFMNILLAIMKIIAEYYPGQLHKAFVIDPPSLFYYLWKGVRAFVELSPVTMVVSISSLDFEGPLEFNNFPSNPRASSLRFDKSTVPSTAKFGSCYSSRFSFTVSHHLDSLKPWHLSVADTSASRVGRTQPTPTILGPSLITPVNARSFSFASPIAREPRGNINAVKKKSFFPSTPLPEKTKMVDPTSINHPRTPGPSFMQSPASLFKKKCHVSRVDKCRQSFLPFLIFYRRPYNEMTYRSMMRPPLGGLLSIVCPQFKRRHMSVSQRP